MNTSELIKKNSDNFFSQKGTQKKSRIKSYIVIVLSTYRFID